MSFIRVLDNFIKKHGVAVKIKDNIDTFAIIQPLVRQNSIPKKEEVTVMGFDRVQHYTYTGFPLSEKIDKGDKIVCGDKTYYVEEFRNMGISNTLSYSWGVISEEETM